jgi:hypothetical protein
VNLLADAEFSAIRTALEVVLTHRCTVTPMTSGAEDAHGNTPSTPGTPVTNVPCTYSTVARAVRDEGGTTLVNVPTLTVSATLAIAVGSQVSAITDQLGVALVSGTFRVERLLDDTAGLGAPLLPVYELRGSRAVE